eukprot:m.66895 g.66895  ORF g.66895 m.66895 type:complete len:84 (+) comp13613_c2_seq2:518-769(+)
MLYCLMSAVFLFGLVLLFIGQVFVFARLLCALLLSWAVPIAGLFSLPPLAALPLVARLVCFVLECVELLSCEPFSAHAVVIDE